MGAPLFEQFARELTASPRPAEATNLAAIDQLLTNVSHVASFEFWSTGAKQARTGYTKRIAHGAPGRVAPLKRD